MSFSAAAPAFLASTGERVRLVRTSWGAHGLVLWFSAGPHSYACYPDGSPFVSGGERIVNAPELNMKLNDEWRERVAAIQEIVTLPEGGIELTNTARR